VDELDEFDELDDLDELEDLPDPDLLEEEETAQDVLAALLAKLGLTATVQSGLSQKDDRGEQVVVLSVAGDGLQELVGKKGEVLVSLQYLTRLMVSQQLRRRVDFVVDVNGYRQKREEGLRRLADRMAEKVVQRGRMVTLEPMSPYDRRLIHVHLRENTAVSTRSIGVGDGRRIQIHLAGQEPTLPAGKTPATPYRPNRR
jgi:spoIIIJ-associated protein